MNEIEHLYMPGSLPILGMRSGVDPASLGRGYWRLINNWRIGRNSVQGRLGCAAVSAAVVASASFRGCWAGYVGTAFRVYIAVKESTTIRIYEGASFGGPYAEVTAVGTRFTTDAFVDFAATRDPGDDADVNVDYVVAVNGTDVPRLIKFNSGGSTAYIGNTFTFDTTRKPQVIPIPWGYVNLADSGSTTYTDSGAQLTSADSGATADQNEWVVTFNAATALNDTSYCTWSSATSLTGSRLNTLTSTQLWLLCKDSAIDPVWNYLDIELGTAGGAYVTVHNATTTSRKEPIYLDIGGGYYLAAFQLPSTSDSGGYDKLRLTCKRTIAANRTFNIAGIFASGPVPGETQYTFTHGRDETMIESPPRDAAMPENGGLFMRFGVSKDIPYTIPFVDELDYIYDPRVPTPDAASDYDTIFVYRKQPDDDDFYLCYTFNSTTTNDVAGGTAPDSVAPQDRKFYRTAPIFGTTTLPTGSTVCASADRLIIGKGNELWASQKGYPFRFNQVFKDDDDDGIPDADSPTVTRFPGEVVKRVYKMPGSLLGHSPVLIFTTNGVWRIESATTEGLSRPTRLNSHGTYLPFSIAEGRGYIYYVDASLVVRRFAGGIESDPISLYKIDDQLEDNDLSYCWGAVYKDRYYLAHRASGTTTNQRVLVYDPVLDEWIRDSYTTAAQNWAGLLVGQYTTNHDFFGVTELGAVYQLEKAAQTTDDGTAISGTLTTGELHDDMWHQRVWGSVGVVVDDITSGSWTVTRTNEYDASTGSGPGVINVDVSTTRAYRWEKSSKSGLVDSGITAAALKISITGKVLAGKYLKAIVMKYSKGRTVNGGDRA
jgi:hypothetical protein